MWFRTSVGTRLWLLVCCQTTIAALLVLTALWTFSKIVPLHHQMGSIRNGRAWLLAIGIAGTGLTFLLGLQVSRAIGPRIQQLVAQVRRFQQSGVNERIGDIGKDDIAVLANALDSGFSSITSRQREREQFLAIVAHELKTPVTAIQGYASLLAAHPENIPNSLRAIEIIRRQSGRLARLIEALLLGMRARSGNLNFQPTPFDMSALVRRVLREMEPFIGKKVFKARVADNVSVLGDETLLEYALWSLFTCAVGLSPDDSPVEISFVGDGCARLSVDIKHSAVPIPDVQELFMPLRFMEYETGAGVRWATGLYLCREIVRVHNGHLQVREVSEKEPEFVMELPI